jgi:hypothetical protein
MGNHAFRPFAPENRHFWRVTDRAGGHPPGHRPTGGLPRGAGHDSRPWPAFAGPLAGDAARPFPKNPAAARHRTPASHACRWPLPWACGPPGLDVPGGGDGSQAAGLAVFLGRFPLKPPCAIALPVPEKQGLRLGRARATARCPETRAHDSRGWPARWFFMWPSLAWAVERSASPHFS